MTINLEFVIPLEKDDLLKQRNDEFFVKELVLARSIPAALDETRTSLQDTGPRFILKHFDDFFSVLVHGKKLAPAITLRAFDRIAKSLELLVNEMEKKFPANESRSEYLCINKMHAYIFCSLMSYLEDTTLHLEVDSTEKARKKKAASKPEAREEWEDRRNKVLLIIHRWLQLPLQNLWNPPIVEESFVQLIADICYKILEHDKEHKDKIQVRDPIFQILGILVKNYLHKITCTIRIIQLVKMYEPLASYLASGVAEMVTKNECPGFIAELNREIEQMTLDEAPARHVSIFMETIAADKPELILPILPNIFEYLNDECYSMRNCAINIIGLLIPSALTGDDLSIENKRKRDECFDFLKMHMLDINAYVRSRVFQILQKLACDRTIPVDRYGPLMTAVIVHLKEKSAIMRKQAVVLLRALLESNPFDMYLQKETIAKGKSQRIIMYEKTQEELVAASGRGDVERRELWNKLSPEIIRAIKDYIVNYADEEEDGDDDEEEEDDEEMHEQIRYLIINKNFKEAIKKVSKISKKVSASLSDDLDDTDQERFYHHIMLYIFMESSKDGATDEETTAKFREQKKKIIKLRRQLKFFDNADTFATAIETAMEQLELMLFSPTASVAIEAARLLALAMNLKIPGAAPRVRKAVVQVFSREESVRNNIADIYRTLYLLKNGEQSTALSTVNRLICLFKGLHSGHSLALSHLIAIWLSNKDLNEQHMEIMWQKYTMKIPGTTVDDSRCAILLLAMVSQTQPEVIISNIDIIIKIGLTPHENQDILLARDSCRALLTIKVSDPMEAPFKRPNNDKIFTELITLLTSKFGSVDVESYVSFATDAINVIYHLANQPEKLIKKALYDINSEMQAPEVELALLAKLLYIVGHSAMKHMAFLDTAVYKESKRRNMILEMKKGKKHQTPSTNNSSITVHTSARKARRSVHHKQINSHDSTTTTEDAGEEALGGATADDADAEAIETELENNIITGNGFFSYFVPLVTNICQYPENYKCPYVQAYSVLALTKMMLISSQFCQQNLQLLITILERSNCPEIRSNILTGLADLMTRFPNEVEPWTAHLYGRLRDNEVSVRSTAVRILANLVKKEMIRVKGQMSEMALCIVDENTQIKTDTKQFFSELAQKGNVLYNILPDILSKLTSDKCDIDEDHFHEIVKYLFGLLQKEKESDALVIKFCQRLKMSVNDRQRRDLAYCLSLLQLGKKGLTTLTNNLPLIKNELHIREVYRALTDIVDSARKKLELKTLAEHLETEIDRLRDNNETDDGDGEKDEDQVAMPPPAVPPKVRKSARGRKKENNSDDDDDADDDNEDQSRRSSTRRSTVDEDTNDKSNDSTLSETNGRERVRRSLRKNREKSPKRNQALPSKRMRASKKNN